MKHTLLPVGEFISRRQKLLAKMPANSIALFPAAREHTRSNDTEYPFCQDKNFYYLTGFNEPEALLVIEKDAQGQGQSSLFCRDKDPLQEVWHGRRVGAEKAKQDYGFEQTFVLAELDEQLLAMLNHKHQLIFAQGAYAQFDQQVFALLAKLRAMPKTGAKAPTQIIDSRELVHELRLFKSAAELELMRQANVISGAAHQRAMVCSQPGANEYQIEAELHHEFAIKGARNPAYGSIVGGGVNATILHYTDNCDALNDGDLLLIDAGCELAGYAADITRTFPVNGKFSPAHKALYNLVLDAQVAVIEAIKPGATFAQLTDICLEVLTQGLLELGIISGELSDLLAEKAAKKYFIHGLGHWLGLDVHDVGDYQVDENKLQQRAFEPDMVLTIEPGLYFAEDAEVAEQYRGVGIRIEDNIVVTASGYENLTVNAAKTVEEIEALMATG
jgi:Xaa-Pro aminopeptidase